MVKWWGLGNHLGYRKEKKTFKKKGKTVTCFSQSSALSPLNDTHHPNVPAKWWQHSSIAIWCNCNLMRLPWILHPKWCINMHSIIVDLASGSPFLLVNLSFQQLHVHSLANSYFSQSLFNKFAAWILQHEFPEGLLLIISNNSHGRP